MGTVARLFPTVSVQLLIIDTKGECQDDSQFNGTVLIGDNSLREFSGWQTGINYLVERGGLGGCGVTVMVNDTLGVHGSPDFLRFFRPREIRRMLCRGMVCGYVDEPMVPMTLLGKPVNGWIRSNILLVPDPVLISLGCVIAPPGWEKLFGDGAEMFSHASLASESFKKFILDWLVLPKSFEAGSRRWHSAKPWLPENYEFLRTKAKMIVLEILLTRNLDAHSSGIFDVRASPSRLFGIFWLLKIMGLRRWLRLWRRWSQDARD